MLLTVTAASTGGSIADDVPLIICVDPGATFLIPIAPAAQLLAESEGLTAHANAVRLRLESR